MKFNVLSSLALATAVFGVTAIEATSVSAATINYNFTVDVDGGSLAGQTFTGSFSFDDAGITGTGEETVDFTSFSFDFQGEEFDENDNIFGEGVVLIDGSFAAIGFDAGTEFNFVPNTFFDPVETTFGYDFGDGNPGFGDVTFTIDDSEPEPNAVPEPATVIGLLATMAVATKIRANKTAAKN